MKKLFLATAAVAALAACDVNVTSNDARTQETLNAVSNTASDLGEQAENFAEDAGDTLSNATRDAAREVQEFGNDVQERVGEPENNKSR